MTIRWIALIAGFGLFAAALPVQAHHSFSAEFDANKPVKLTGAVTRVEWMNPHAYFYMDVKDEAGHVANWALEMGSVNGLMRAGWTRSTLKIGDVVTVEGGRAKNGTNPGQRQGGDAGQHRPEIICSLESRPGRGSQSSEVIQTSICEHHSC